MKHELIDRIVAALKEEEFTNVVKHPSSHSLTVSAEKGQVQAVFHMTEQQATTHRSEANEHVPAFSEIRIVPTFPQVSAAAGRTHPVGEAGQEVHRQKAVKD